MGKLVGVNRFGHGWEQIAAPEQESVQVLKRAPKPSNVYIKTQDDSGFLRAPPEPRKFDPDELDNYPPPKPRPSNHVQAGSAKTVSAKPLKKAKGRDPEKHREYMRRYMKKRRAESKLTP